MFDNIQQYDLDEVLEVKSGLPTLTDDLDREELIRTIDQVLKKRNFVKRNRQ